MITDTGSDVWNSIVMISASSGWVVGNSGVILQYSNFYNPEGVFTSGIIDSGVVGTSWDIFALTQTLPTGASITISTRSGNTSTPDGTWSAFSAELADNLGSAITSPAARYIQYRVTFTRGASGTSTPQLDDVTISYNSPTTQALNDISVVTTSDIWAVANNGVFIHYNGTNWTQFADMGTVDLFGIYMLSATDGWAVGGSGKIYHYNGAAWSEFVDTGASAWNSVYVVSATDGWVVGNGGNIYHYNGVAWSAAVSPTGVVINDIHMVSSTQGWAVANSGEILFYNGTAWSINTDVGATDLNGVFMVSATDGWAVGNAGKIYHYNGAAWSEFVDTGGDIWNEVYLVSATDGWAVGNGGVMSHYNGVAWANVLSPTGDTLNGVRSVSVHDGWAVGVAGTILHFSRGAVYQTFGMMTSSAFSMSDASPVQVINWDQNIPTCSPSCQIKLQVRSAPNNGGVPGTFTSWYGATGVNTYFTSASGTIASTALNGNQWVQYRAEFTGDGTSTPVLQEVRVNYK
ncbi:MAG: hypothetical protein A2261_01140 [Candidatus Magasanikbacteria bacterium RIFOXYA2_FULL_44_8]|uniref:Uncharacterized protein n=1 Tax=Candidatus Magasanikbacteria bacterium RIFOXYA2_FULL_44_8 TaxID=1798696 RepID=A0A1F6NK75_9BACT|nr:MAG: hypothetical protein A2261_01140 [Candidatus Magasanikbacteria bacterium RIFOXYA2_FULL_44_8]